MEIFGCLVAVLLIGSCSASLDYNDQENWSGSCNLPGSKKQSPVDVIKPNTMTRLGDTLIVLGGNAAALTAENDNADNFVKISFGSDTITYAIPGKESVQGTALQLHLHWGNNDKVGSEHTLDGKTFSAEAHLVTSYTVGVNTKYAVIGRFFELGDENEQIKQMITSAQASGLENRKIQNFDLTALYPSDINEVITYEGSLTTPGCDEIVYWIVVPKPLTISAAQLQLLRAVTLGDGVTGSAKTWNFRTIQALNGREFTCYSAAISTLVTSPLLIAALLLLNLIAFN